jgi:hypothetical protein
MIKKKGKYSYQIEKDRLTLVIQVVGVGIVFLWIKTSLQLKQGQAFVCPETKQEN